LPLPVLPERLLAPDWMVRGLSLAPRHQVGGGGEPGHVQAYLGEDGLCAGLGDAGDVIEARRCGADGRVGAGARCGAGGSVGVDAAGGGNRAGQLVDPAGERADLGAQGIYLVQQHLGQLGVMLAGPAGERFDQRGPLGSHPAAGQVRERPGAALAGDQRLDHVADRLGGHRAGHRRHLDQRVLKQLLQPGPVPGPLPVKSVRSRV